MEHQFTQQIKAILKQYFGQHSDDLFERSPLLQYLNIKTRSATQGSKTRGNFANLYAIYVLVEDYLAKGFDVSSEYSEYEGSKFTALLKRQRELPFGSKLQNHALNHRVNQEFQKYFYQLQYTPILRDAATSRYWFNENLLRVDIHGEIYNIAQIVIKVIDAYIEAKQDAFEKFISNCERLKTLSNSDPTSVKEFILSLLEVNVDARIFEIVSYSILKFYYLDQVVYFGFELENVQPENLALYKTGRTNANDGGIDFVMKPLGRFFQVTETLDVKKYFLDIDKIERYPVSFVIKSDMSVNALHTKLQEGAESQYPVRAIVDKYMMAIEEIINIPMLKNYLENASNTGYLQQILDEIILQSKVEFNIE